MSATLDIHAAMQQVAEFGGDHGIMEQAGFTFPILIPFQAARLARGELIDPQEHAYGPHPRQKLDVYLPQSDIATAPVILHAYGGGFALGGKRAFPGVYQNVGTFFAQQGFVHIVMDYRLLEHGATYPSGPEDVSLALQWLAGGNIKQADINNVFLLGESAGGMHMANLLWDEVPSVKAISSISGLQLRGLAFLSSVYHFESEEELSPPAITYYGSAENALNKSLLSIRKTSKDTTPILAIYGTHDPKKVVLSGLEALKGYFAIGNKAPAPFELCEAKMHNHISLPLTVGLGQGSDDWAYDFIKWAKKNTVH